MRAIGEISILQRLLMRRRRTGEGAATVFRTERIEMWHALQYRRQQMPSASEIGRINWIKLIPTDARSTPWAVRRALIEIVLPTAFFSFFGETFFVVVFVVCQPQQASQNKVGSLLVVYILTLFSEQKMAHMQIWTEEQKTEKKKNIRRDGAAKHVSNWILTKWI